MIPRDRPEPHTYVNVAAILDRVALDHPDDLWRWVYEHSFPIAVRCTGGTVRLVTSAADIVAWELRQSEIYSLTLPHGIPWVLR